jgi:hypothetical protein
MELIERIGTYMGAASFFGLAVLAMLYFSQARDVRRLRDWAGRAPERAVEAAQQASHVYAQQAEPIRRERLRRQRRAGGGLEARYVAMILTGIVIMGLGLIFLVFKPFEVDSGNGPSASRGGSKSTVSPVAPGAVTVAVLNGTDVPGLAAKVGDDVEANGFKLGPVTNSETSYASTTAMYERGHQREAEAVAKALGLGRVALMTSAVKALIGTAPVVVIVGADRVEV